MPLYFCLMKNSTGLLLCLLLFFLISCNNSGPGETDSPQSTVPVSTPSIVATLPHDTSHFTEGLEFYDSTLLESTGNYGPSKLVQVEPKTGKILKKVDLGPKYFGEGIVFFKDKVYQLTYKNKIGFIYDATTFRKLSEFTIPSQEGWGMTTDGNLLIMSDGTSQLTYLDPETLQVRKTITVSDGRGTISKLNELEFIKGFIYANVYTTNDLVKIDPVNGLVVARLNLSSLANEAKSLYPGSLEINGIAYDSLTNKTYITGKMWPKIYEISFAW